jgi:haloalkane dehalogenase
MKPFSYPKELYPFQSKWITIHGNRIHYIDEGKGETILFCHPPVSSSFMYRNMIRELSKSFRCIAIDFPGFGLSEPGAGYIQSIAAQAEIVDGLLRGLALKEVCLLMQEVGGHAAMKVFIQQPSLLRALIITDTIPFPCSSYPKISSMLNLVNGSVFNFFNTNFNFLIRAMTRFGIRKRKLSKKERSVYKQMFDTKEKRRNITHMLYELVRQEKLLMEIQTAFETTFSNIPALIMYGENDPLTGLGVPQKLHQLLTNAELHWIHGEAHFPHEGAPQEMSDLITTWLKKNRRN